MKRQRIDQPDCVLLESAKEQVSSVPVSAVVRWDFEDQEITVKLEDEKFHSYEIHFNFERLSESVEDLENFNADLKAFHRHSLGKTILGHLTLQRATAKGQHVLKLLPKADRPKEVDNNKAGDTGEDTNTQESSLEQQEQRGVVEEKNDADGDEGEGEGKEKVNHPQIISVPKDILAQSYKTSVKVNGMDHDLYFFQGEDNGVTIYARDEILAWHAIKTTMEVARSYSSHPELVAQHEGEDEASMFERLKRCLFYVRDEEDRRKQHLILEKFRPKRKVRRQTRMSISKRKGGRGKVLKTVVKKEGQVNIVGIG